MTKLTKLQAGQRLRYAKKRRDDGAGPFPGDNLLLKAAGEATNPLPEDLKGYKRRLRKEGERARAKARAAKTRTVPEWQADAASFEAEGARRQAKEKRAKRAEEKRSKRSKRAVGGIGKTVEAPSKGWEAGHAVNQELQSLVRRLTEERGLFSARSSVEAALNSGRPEEECSRILPRKEWQDLLDKNKRLFRERSDLENKAFDDREKARDELATLKRNHAAEVSKLKHELAQTSRMLDLVDRVAGPARGGDGGAGGMFPIKSGYMLVPGMYGASWVKVPAHPDEGGVEGSE